MSFVKFNPLSELDELILQAQEQQDCCFETGPNEAMRRAIALIDVRAAVAHLVESMTGIFKALDHPLDDQMADSLRWAVLERDARAALAAFRGES